MTPLLPLLVLWTAAIALAFLDGRRRWVGLLGVAALGTAFGCEAALLVRTLAEGTVESFTGSPDGPGITLRADPMGVLFALVTTLVLFTALALETAGRADHRRFPALVLFQASGLVGLFLTGDAFNLYVFFELSMVAGFVLAGYGRGALEIRNALIFTVMNLIGSLFLLGAIAGLYRLSGSLDLAVIAASLEPSPARALLALLVLCAFLLKSGLFPFHGWVPPVYSGTKPVVAAILAGALANVGSYGLLRFGPALFAEELRSASTLLLVLSSLSILHGGVLALYCPRPSAVLAYSSVNQAGYVLGGIALGGPAGFAATLLYALTSSLDKTLLFLILGQRSTFSGPLGGVGAASLSGMPPTFGFVGKAALFLAALQAGSPWFAGVVLVGTGLVMVALFQRYRPFGTGEEDEDAPAWARLGLLGGLAALLVGLGLAPGWPVEIAWSVGRALAEGR